MVHRALLPRHIQVQGGFIGLCSWREHEMSSYPIPVFYSRRNWVLEWGSDLPTSRSGSTAHWLAIPLGKITFSPRIRYCCPPKKETSSMEQEQLQATSTETETLLAPQVYTLRPITLLPSSETQVTFDTALFWETMLSHLWVFLMIPATFSLIMLTTSPTVLQPLHTVKGIKFRKNWLDKLK